MKIHPINPVNNPVKLQLEIGSSGKITANIKFNRKERGENTEEKLNKDESNLGNLPNELHFNILNKLNHQELGNCMRVSKQFYNTIKECPSLNRKVQDIQSRAILESLKEDKDDYVRSAVAEACGNIGDNDWTRDILQRLQNDTYDDVKAAVAKACGRIGDKAWTRAILQSLKEDTSAFVKICVVEALLKN